ncbi:hypothetical protein ACQPZA_31530 [Pseudonocardia xinjiangensis]|uniref:hypothetical protein n=1 Tax=Pseudonocardia xinjiangensis TaxID=75289 RepID=UPI003D8EF1C3
MSDLVDSVHTTRPDDSGAVEIVFISERGARAYAKDRSTDLRIPAAPVTRFVIGQLGTRHPVAWFVDGKEQPHRAARPGKLYATDGHACASRRDD